MDDLIGVTKLRWWPLACVAVATTGAGVAGWMIEGRREPAPSIRDVRPRDFAADLAPAALRIDSTTFESFGASITAIAESLPPAEREDFRLDVFVFGEPAEIYGHGLAAEVGRLPEALDFIRFYDGKTAAELHVEAVRFRAARDKLAIEARAKRDASRAEP